jgi:HSP20 family molecular chaperone IbpA
MATSCPTTCPTTAGFAGVRPNNFPFEPTFGPSTCPTGYTNFPPSWYGFDFPASKTYSSIFNKEIPCPPTSMPVNYPVERTPFGYSSPANWPVTGPSNWYNTPFERNAPFYPSTPYYGNNLPSTWYPTMTTPFSGDFNCAPSSWYPTAERSVSPYSFGGRANNWFNPSNSINSSLSPLSSNWWNNTVNTLCNVAFRPSNPIEFYCLTNPIRVLDREGNRCMWLCFDLRGYKPEEITVTMNKAEKCIIVEATHEVKEGKEHHVMRKFYRKFAFPETLAKVDFAKCELKSYLTADGMLTVECPLPKMTTEEIARCPVMSRNFTAAPFAAPYNNYYGCPSTCNTAPITTKVC